MTAPTGRANFALSVDGTLVYVPGGAATAPAAQPRSLVWVNRQGREEPIKAPARPYAVVRLSPDGTRVALDLRDQTSDIWTLDLGRQTLTPLNLDSGVDMSPVWTPDGRRIIWASSRGGGNPNVYWQAADGTGAAARLTTHLNAQFPTSVSPDGTLLAFFGTQTAMDTPLGVARPGSGTSLNISVLMLDGSSAPATRPLIESAAAKLNPEISPDGQWIAYQSDESGQVQIYVRPFRRSIADAGRFLPKSAPGRRGPAAAASSFISTRTSC